MEDQQKVGSIDHEGSGGHAVNCLLRSYLHILQMPCGLLSCCMIWFRLQG